MCNDDVRLLFKKNKNCTLDVFYSPPDSCQNDSFPPAEMIKTHDNTCWTCDSSPDMRGSKSVDVCRLFILPHRALSLCTVIYSRSLQNHTDASSSSCIPSDPSPPFQLAAGRGREKRCQDQTEEGWLRRELEGRGGRGIHLFSIGKKLPASPAVKLLCSSSRLLRCSFCSCQCGSMTPLPRGRVRSGEGGRARGATSEALFRRVHVRRDDFYCDTFGFVCH